MAQSHGLPTAAFRDAPEGVAFPLGVPANDNFANAATVDGDSWYVYNHNIDTTNEATKEVGEPVPLCAPTMGKTVWYKFTARHGGTLRANTWNSAPNYDTVLVAYTYSSPPGGFLGLSEIQCNDDTGPGGHSRVTFQCEAGRDYYFQVGGLQGAGGRLNFQLSGCLNFYQDPLANSIQPVCVQNPAAEKHFQVLYVVPTGDAGPDQVNDNSFVREPRIREEVAEMNGFLRSEAQRLGRQADFRVKCVNGVTDVSKVLLATISSMTSSKDVSDRLLDAGYNDPNTKYIAWVEGKHWCNDGYGSMPGNQEDGLSQFSPTNAILGTGRAVIRCDDSAHGPLLMMHEATHAMGGVRSTAPHHPPPVPDGGFENGPATCPPDDWVAVWNTACRSTDRSYDAETQDSVQSLRSLFVADSGPLVAVGLRSARIDTTDGEYRGASAWFSGPDATGLAYLFIEFLDQNGAVISNVGNSLDVSNTWTKLSVDGWAPSGTMQAHILIYACTGCVGDFYVDEVAWSSGVSAGHCWDMRSVMCYGNNVNNDHNPAPAPKGCFVLRYDCNEDDYFSPNPTPGTWIYSHWNVGHPYNQYLQFPAGPSNDFFESRVTITSAPFSDSRSTRYATHEMNEPLGAGTNCLPISNTVWYTYTPAASGQLDITVPGAFGAALYSGPAIGSLGQLACSIGGRLVYNVVGGTTYHIQVGGTNGATTDELRTDLTCMPDYCRFRPTTPTLACDPNPSLAGQQITCSFMSTDLDSTRIRYLVDWGDSPLVNVPTPPNWATPGVTQTALHSYASEGSYTVRVMAMDDGSPTLESGWATHGQTVLNAPPAAPTLSCSPSPSTTGDKVTCTFSSTDGSSGVFYMVAWGDGATVRVPATGYATPGALQSAAHVYAAAASYGVTVVATDNAATPADSPQTSRTQVVNPPPAIPNGGFEGAAGCPPPSWTDSSGPGLLRACASLERARSGLWSLKLTDQDAAYSGAMSATRSTHAGDRRAASAWVSGAPGTAAFVFVKFFNAAGAEIGDAVQSVTLVDAWQKVTADGTAPEGTNSARLLVYACTGCVGDWFADDTKWEI